MEVNQFTDEGWGMGASKSAREPENIPGGPLGPGHSREAQGMPESLADEGSGADADERVPKDAGDGSGRTDEPVVLNRSGKGIIPYEKHKALRVENSTLREQLDAAKSRLEELQRQEKEPGSNNASVTDEALAKHLEVLD